MTMPHCPYCHDDVTEQHDYGQFHCPACGGVWSPGEEPERYQEPIDYPDYW